MTTHTDLLERACIEVHRGEPVKCWGQQTAPYMQLAGKLKVTRNTVLEWRLRNRVPQQRWLTLEYLTGGNVTAAEFEKARYGK